MDSNYSFMFLQRLVKEETAACRHAHSPFKCRLFFKSILILVLVLALWRWLNGVDSLESNQECIIGYRNLINILRHCLASIRKIEDRRNPECLKTFKPSKGTHFYDSQHHCWRYQTEPRYQISMSPFQKVLHDTE